MSEIGIFSPEQARLLWQDYLSRQQLTPQISQNYPRRRIIDEVSPHRVFVKSASGEEIPAYGCLQITGTEEYGGRTTLTVTKPTSTEGEYVFNSQFAIPIGEAGWAYRYGIVVMLGTPPTVSGTSYRPIGASWEIEEGTGPFVVFGDHNADPRGLIGRIQSERGGSHRIWFTIISVECVSATAMVLTVEATYYTGGCTAAIPGEDSYGQIIVEDICGILNYYTADWLVGKAGSATYMYPRSDYCEAVWLVDEICGTPECA